MSIRTATIAGIKVPAMAIGTWAWGDSMWDYKPEDYENIKEAWTACNKVGLTFYDTAEIYGEGESERIIGRLLKDTPADVKKNIYMATKFLPYPRPANWFLFRPAVVTALQKSLARLGLDSVDLYQLHGPTTIHSYASIGQQLAKCKELGLAKEIGVSNFSKAELIKMSAVLAKYDVKIASNQIEFNLLRQGPEKNGLLEYMRENNIACLAYSPLAMGRLTGKYTVANPAPSKRRFSSQYTAEMIEPLIQLMKTLGEKYNVPVSAIALAWVIAKGAIPLGGARNASQAEQNAKATTFELSVEDVALLSEKGFDGKTELDSGSMGRR